MFSIKNKVVLITGTSRGIGRNIAEAFLKQNAIVIGISRNTKKIIKNKNYFHFVCDLTNIKKLQKVIFKILKTKKKN